MARDGSSKLHDVLYNEYVFLLFYHFYMHERSLINQFAITATPTPIDRLDFPAVKKWVVDEYASTESKRETKDGESQLGFYDLQIPKTTNAAQHNRKLSLILDLDQTLVHATKMTEMFSDIIGPYLAAVAVGGNPALNFFETFVINNFLQTCNPKYIESFTSRIEFSSDSMIPPYTSKDGGSRGFSLSEPRQLLVTWLDGEMYFIKLRPGLRQFLRELAEIYELHIYTKANRNYLNFLINELDPCGKLFTSAIARDDSPDLDVDLKVLNRVCCRPASEIVVFDDRVDIWVDSPSSVLRAQPYNFLTHKKLSVVKALEEIIQTSPSPTSSATSVALDFDCHLFYMKEVLQRVHAEFSKPGCMQPVAQILSKMRKRVLSGMIVMFTGFTDMGSFMKDTEEYGAVCRMNGLLPEDMEKPGVEDRVVLVAAKHTKRVYDTKKENASARIVHGAWLDHVRATWTIPDMDIFDHIRFRVNPDGSFGSMDNWEVLWIAANQHLTNTDSVNMSGEMSVVSASTHRDMKKRRRD
jgi:hypothetical protein